MKRLTLLLLMPVMLTCAVPLYAEVYQDEKGVWRQKSYTESPAWKPPIETSGQAYKEYMKAETTEKARLHQQYQELVEKEAQERSNASDQKYNERMQAIDAESEQRRKENQIDADERDIEWDLKHDRKIGVVGRQPVELKSRLLKKGYSEEAIDKVINEQPNF